MIRNQDFVRYHKNLPAFDFDLFIESMHRPRRISIRVNTLKTTPALLLGQLEVTVTPIPWCNEGFWLDDSASSWISKTLSYALGYYYIQEASSMIPVTVLSPRPGERILDLCAAPGSKTTQIGQYMRQQGTIVANEVNSARAKILVANLQRCGLTNVVVTALDGVGFHKYGEKFDRVLVDPPCSAIGTGLRAINRWSENMIHRLSELQKRLIVAGFRALSEGGVLVYSTCTTSLEENEEVIEYLLNTYEGKAILEEISVPGLNCISGLTESTRGAIRIFSYHNNTDDFFVARIRKLA